MVFQNEESSLKLEITGYEFPADGGEPGSDDRNWLLLRCTWGREDGRAVRDTNPCLLTYELREMTAGLKVLRGGVRDSYESAFVEPYFELSAQAEDEERFHFSVEFFLPNSMDEESAQIDCVLNRQALDALIGELDALCAKFPDRA